MPSADMHYKAGRFSPPFLSSSSPSPHEITIHRALKSFCYFCFDLSFWKVFTEVGDLIGSLSC